MRALGRRTDSQPEPDSVHPYFVSLDLRPRTRRLLPLPLQLFRLPGFLQDPRDGFPDPVRQAKHVVRERLATLRVRSTLVQRSELRVRQPARLSNDQGLTLGTLPQTEDEIDQELLSTIEDEREDASKLRGQVREGRERVGGWRKDEFGRRVHGRQDRQGRLCFEQDVLRHERGKDGGHPWRVYRGRSWPLRREKRVVDEGGCLLQSEKAFCVTLGPELMMLMSSLRWTPDLHRTLTPSLPLPVYSSLDNLKALSKLDPTPSTSPTFLLLTQNSKPPMSYSKRALAALSTMRQTFPPSPTWTATDIPSLSGYVCAVTGGYTGVGFETVKALLEHDAHVLILGRSASKAEDAIKRLQSQGKVEFVEVDLADLKSVRKGAEEIGKKVDRLDVLFVRSFPPRLRTIRAPDGMPFPQRPPPEQRRSHVPAPRDVLSSGHRPSVGD